MLQENIRSNKKTLRGVICLLLAVVVLVSLFSSVSVAGIPIDSGHVGPNSNYATWTLYDNGTIVIGGGTVRSVHTVQSVWALAGHGDNVTHIVFTDGVTGHSNLAGLFSTLPNLVEIENIHFLNTTNTTDMRNMFRGTTNLTNVDVSNFDMSNVTTTLSMFQESGVTSLDVGGWDVSQVRSMESMFWNANNLTTLDVSNWDVSNVTRMHRTFQATSSLTALDVSNWDTGNVTVMYHMFAASSSITTLDVSNWDTSNVTNMAQMFRGMTSLTNLDVSSWDTSSVTRTDAMFSGAISLTALDFSNWDTSNVTTMYNMFFNTQSLRALTFGPDWIAPAANNNTRLPVPSTTPPFVGRWQNVGTGTVDKAAGTLSHTSATLFNGAAGASNTWVWQVSYTVIFAPGTQGTFPAVTHTVWSGNATPAPPSATPGNAGYAFIGWLPAVAPFVTDNVTYVAQWQAYAFTLTYNANTGTNPPAAVPNIPSGTNFALGGAGTTTAPFHADGDVLFMGWSTSQVAVLGADDAALIPTIITHLVMDDNRTVFAVWGLDTTGTGTPDVWDGVYSITYDANTGTNAPASQTGILNGTTLNLRTEIPTAPASPTGTGTVLFLGWSEQQVGILLAGDAAPADLRAPGSSITVDGNVVLYAVWRLSMPGGGGPGTGNATIVDNNNNYNNNNNNAGSGGGSGYLGTGNNEGPYAGYAIEPPAEKVLATILLFVIGIACFVYRRVEETKEEGK